MLKFSMIKIVYMPTSQCPGNRLIYSNTFTISKHKSGNPNIHLLNFDFNGGLNGPMGCPHDAVKRNYFDLTARYKTTRISHHTLGFELLASTRHHCWVNDLGQRHGQRHGQRCYQLALIALMNCDCSQPV